MKLLGWMHRKFRQNSNEPFKDFAIGNSCNCLLGHQPSLDDHHSLFPKPSRPHKPPPTQHKDTLLRQSFAGLDAVRSIQEEAADFDPDGVTELFHGLLAIGTLGSSDPPPLDDEPATPTFAASFEHVVTEKEAEVTENDLKLINEELEKVLGADAKEDKCNDSSGRTSHVSSVTLGGRDSNAVCPLQGYLFGSPIELPETTPTVVKSSGKEHRTSLGELFQRTKMVEEKPLKKTLLKRRMLRSSTNVSPAAAAAAAASTDSVSADTKLNKILQMFHKKVHPERESTSSDKKGGIVVGCGGAGAGAGAGGPNYKTQAQEQAHKMGSESKNSNDEDHRVVPDEDIVIVPKGPICKQQQRIRRYKCPSNSHSFALGASDSNGNREHWIKTDADYLVLEL